MEIYQQMKVEKEAKLTSLILKLQKALEMIIFDIDSYIKITLIMSEIMKAKQRLLFRSNSILEAEEEEAEKN